MTRVGRVGPNVLLILTEGEAELISTLIVEYLYLLGDTPDDPILNRLFPAAYGDDRAASNEFTERTRDRARARKIDNAELVGSAVRLDPPLELGPPVVERWLMVIADLRLLMAQRLDIRADSDPVPDTDLGLLYSWLGLLQQVLLETLEEVEP